MCYRVLASKADWCFVTDSETLLITYLRVAQFYITRQCTGQTAFKLTSVYGVASACGKMRPPNKRVTVGLRPVAHRLVYGIVQLDVGATTPQDVSHVPARAQHHACPDVGETGERRIRRSSATERDGTRAFCERLS